jgi:hypothetical protein
MGIETAGLEKRLQQGGALLGPHTALHHRLVIQPGLSKEVHHRPGCAGLGVGRTKDHALEPGVQHRAAAHGAGFQRHVQGAAVEPVVAQVLGGRAQGRDLGVCGGVVLRDRCISTGADHDAVLHHDRAHRHLAGRGRGAGLLQGKAHERGVVGQGHAGECRGAPDRAMPRLA